jgi:hypothetical protein
VLRVLMEVVVVANFLEDGFDGDHGVAIWKGCDVFGDLSPLLVLLLIRRLASSGLQALWRGAVILGTMTLVSRSRKQWITSTAFLFPH